MQALPYSSCELLLRCAHSSLDNIAYNILVIILAPWTCVRKTEHILRQYHDVANAGIAPSSLLKTVIA